MSKPKKVALYARVSTDSQTTENQLRRLRAVAERHGWTVAAERGPRCERCEGAARTPTVDPVLRGVARRESDMIAAWSVDRLGRSLQDLLAFLLELQSKRVDLYLH